MTALWQSRSSQVASRDLDSLSVQNYYMSVRFLLLSILLLPALYLQFQQKLLLVTAELVPIVDTYTVHIS